VQRQSLPSTFCRTLGKEKSLSRRQVMETETLSSVLKGTRQRGILFRVPIGLALSKEVSSGPHSSLCGESRKLALGKGSTSGPFASPFVKCTMRHSSKGAFCQLLWSRYSAKKLYQFPSVPSLPSAMVMALGKEHFVECNTRQSVLKTHFYLFLSFHPNKQNIYIINITYITESTHVSPTPYISQISPHQTSFTNISLTKYLTTPSINTNYYQHQQV
jgi:hypothetical protein